MSATDAIPVLPRLAATLLAPLPLYPLAWAIGRLAAEASARHPGIHDRLGPHAGKRFLIDPTDLPFAVALTPSRPRPVVALVRCAEEIGYDARIAGPLAALVGMVQGRLDGDALFFSRDIAIEGDTEAVVALRNALDDAEIDLVEEFLRGLGPLAGAAGTVVRPAARAAERLTGLPLARPERLV